MNIAQQVETFVEGQESDILPGLEREYAETERILNAIRHLQTDEAFKSFHSLVLNRELSEAREQLEVERNVDEIRKLQGFISYQWMFNMAKLEQYYWNHFESLKGRIAQENKKKELWKKKK